MTSGRGSKKRWSRNGYKVIPDFPDYMLNIDGVVRNKDTGYTLHSDYSPAAWRVKLRKDGKTYERSIKRLLKETFKDDYLWP